ncbi:hypothetical protein ES703_74443 [subsurface metagenome]
MTPNDFFVADFDNRRLDLASNHFFWFFEICEIMRSKLSKGQSEANQVKSAPRSS